MAHTKSTIKRIKQNRKRRLRNMSVKSNIKTQIKKLETALEASDNKEAAELLKEIYRSLDKAVSKGIIKKNTASRKKARLATQVHANSA
jgi:small subunit ribosomal protein S20